jgi:hypothetical protein
MADDNGSNTGNAFGPIFWVISVVIAIAVIAAAVVAIASSGTPPPPTDAKQCSTSCAVFVKLECPGDRVMGTCFGISACEAPMHACGTNP